MVKELLNVILGMLGVVMILSLSALYGLACVVWGWNPDITFQTWAYITIGLSAAILIISISLWRYTQFKEGIHGWILVPGLFLGKLWINAMDEISFQNFFIGSLYIGLVLIVLSCFEIRRSWSKDRNTMKTKDKDLTTRF